MRDLLAYSATIVKASQDYEDTPWLAYNSHFRRQRQLLTACTMGPNLQWTVYTLHKPDQKAMTMRARKETGSEVMRRLEWIAKDKVGNRYNPYVRMPVCLRWNLLEGCRLVGCRFSTAVPSIAIARTGPITAHSHKQLGDGG